MKFFQRIFPISAYFENKGSYEKMLETVNVPRKISQKKGVLKMNFRLNWTQLSTWKILERKSFLNLKKKIINTYLRNKESHEKMFQTNNVPREM